ncbi:hypothetical protein ACQ4LE_008386 [Meloidogyne hapla]
MYQRIQPIISKSALFTELCYKLRNIDRFFCLFLDSLLGILTIYLIPNDWHLIKYFWQSVYLSIEQLENLINWLTQNPAGLKLNDALNTFLSNFFLYHIHLWKSYIIALQHSSMHWTFIFFSTLGIAVLLAFISDFLRIVSLHLFCFHIYTYRLASLSWSAFSSFGRAFRGNKWNPLRKRIDTINLDIKQLFLVTIFFIILLFLLPTIGIYFLVFGLLWRLIDNFSLALKYLAFCFRWTIEWFTSLFKIHK